LNGDPADIGLVRVGSRSRSSYENIADEFHADWFVPINSFGEDEVAPRTITRMGKSMTKLLAVCFVAILAGFASPASAQEKPTLRLVQTIALPGVKGRLAENAKPRKKAKRHF
jgi:hypothetical protein